ncbi:copper homeostasis protein CutC [Maribacter sp. 2307ULW6-5]|uniref:copper homeostasis protein CutC n=1 Tax=Maribacter sp. 2307ULW6-5 TaxID=3386275 RepID=UPI0039BC8B3E
MIVEVCANSLESALNAQEAGADRIELCSELGVGGVTPSLGLIRLVTEKLHIPVHVLVRPRSAHFTYTEWEFQVMLKDIEACRANGAAGIVSGVLHPDATVNVSRTQALVNASGPLHFTFHRAFDWVPDPVVALEALEGIGVQTILSSGQKPSAAQGAPLLGELQRRAKSCVLMAGGGVNPDNATMFLEAGLSAIHLSGTAFGHALPMDGKLSMNSQKHLAEHQVAVTQTETIRQVVKHVK